MICISSMYIPSGRMGTHLTEGVDTPKCKGGAGKCSPWLESCLLVTAPHCRRGSMNWWTVTNTTTVCPLEAQSLCHLIPILGLPSFLWTKVQFMHLILIPGLGIIKSGYGSFWSSSQCTSSHVTSLPLTQWQWYCRGHIKQPMLHSQDGGMEDTQPLVQTHA